MGIKLLFLPLSIAFHVVCLFHAPVYKMWLILHFLSAFPCGSLLLSLAWWLQWHPVLRTLKNQIEENTGHTFNSLLCNLYRNEKDSVDWHSDDEPSLGKCPIIASLSFGATRTFEMRKKPPPVSTPFWFFNFYVLSASRYSVKKGVLLFSNLEDRSVWFVDETFWTDCLLHG